MYQFSPEAQMDISGIAKYNINKFGIKQARNYRDNLNKCFLSLSENSFLGSSASNFIPGLRYFPFKSHSIFYKSQKDYLLIVRILNQNMDYRKHLLKD